MSGRRDREITIGIDRAAGRPDVYRLFAECPDEVTSVICIGAGVPFPRTQAELEASPEFSEMLIAEHMERCASCRIWARVSA